MDTPRPEASLTLGGEGVALRAGFRAATAEELAGGPLEVEAFVDNTGAAPLYLALAGEGSRLRPARFSFAATVEGLDVELDDPEAGAPDAGGPATVVAVPPGESRSQSLLVNEFLRLEKLSQALGPGEARALTLRCRRPMPLAVTEAQAFRVGPSTPEVDVTLTLSVRRDDRALEALVAGLAARSGVEWTAVPSPDRERAIVRLAALRHPGAAAALRSLQRHGDPAVRRYAERALRALERFGGRST